MRPETLKQAKRVRDFIAGRRKTRPNLKLPLKDQLPDGEGGFWLIEVEPIRTVAFVRHKVKGQREYDRYLGDLVGAFAEDKRTLRKSYANPKVEWKEAHPKIPGRASWGGKPPPEVIEHVEKLLKYLYEGFGWAKNPPGGD